jgi:acyl-CoA synthetase (NDP forming)
LIDEQRIARILRGAAGRAEDALSETEAFEILRALGFNTPASLFVRDAREASAAPLARLGGERVVLKAVSPRILHKTEVGGVRVVANDGESVAAAVREMAAGLCGEEVAGYSVSEFVAYDPRHGGELLLGLRRTGDFGPVVSLGPGGVYAEFLSENLKPGRSNAILSPTLTRGARLADVLGETAVVRLLTSPPRGQKPRVGMHQLVAAVDRLVWLAQRFGHLISEFEINPLVVSGGELFALDALVRLGAESTPRARPRPLHKLKNLLEPESAAVVGVSERLNPGHVIVNNLLREGFDRRRLYVVKPGARALAGCRCFPDVAHLPERVDMLVLAVSAAQVPELLCEAVEQRKAEAVVVIPGGLEEKSGGERLAARVRASLERARASDWQGPLVNGGNCLGIRSRPGRYDTMFIPAHKLPPPEAAPSPVALVSQSGAFAVARAGKLASLNPKYSITVGNQTDLTVGDYLTYLKDDPELELFAVYVEGFAPLDGLEFLRAALEISASGRAVVLYRGGRTAAGAKAASSHTARVAGDYAVTRALAGQAGVVVAESLEDFEDLVRLFALLRDRAVRGLRLGAVSNAGFECVAFADNAGGFELPEFGAPTVGRLRAVFERCRIGEIVDAHNPLDLTPMADDAAYEEAVRAVLEDEGVDAGVVGIVPPTPALNTLARGEGHREDLTREDSVVARLLRLRRESPKPFVAVVDAGALYDPMAARLERGGVPAFRTADRALRLFETFCRSRLGRRD